MSAIKAPERILNGHTLFCPGCGHGIATRIISESIEELGLGDKAIVTLDVACGCLQMDTWKYDTVQTAHGRVVATAVGIKHVRPNNLSLAYFGDGAAYAIGLAETMYGAIRDDNVTVIVVNNNTYGMTGGQMSPTTIEGQVTTSSPYGRDIKKTGKPFDIVNAIGKMNIEYLARGELTTPGEIVKTKKYIKKALQNQMDNKGFSLVEILSPCPTNWGLSPINSVKKIREVVNKVYNTGEFVNRGGK